MQEWIDFLAISTGSLTPTPGTSRYRPCRTTFPIRQMNAGCVYQPHHGNIQEKVGGGRTAVSRMNSGTGRSHDQHRCAIVTHHLPPKAHSCRRCNWKASSQHSWFQVHPVCKAARHTAYRRSSCCWVLFYWSHCYRPVANLDVPRILLPYWKNT